MCVCVNGAQLSFSFHGLLRPAVKKLKMRPRQCLCMGQWERREVVKVHERQCLSV